MSVITIRRSEYRKETLSKLKKKRPELTCAAVYDYGLASLLQMDEYFKPMPELDARLLRHESMRKLKEDVV